jgi:asparagine synthase (glutamine-hydrolysing)
VCGIAGILDPTGRLNSHAVAATLEPILRHRGPDGFGAFHDGPVGLYHWRLAIIDTTATGDQPMTSANGRYTIVFNGEIYNYRELRTQLESVGTRWRGSSDTEVFLEAIATWGPERAFRMADGMFALALWDHSENTLILARDRFGEKPMYYARIGKVLAFASELKALRAIPGFTPRINRNAVAGYVRFNAVPAPETIYEGVTKLAPGCWISVPLDQRTPLPTPVTYWSPSNAIESARATPFRGTRTDAANELDTLLRKSVATRSIADVPLGAFLSGGIDSSTIVALMQAQASGPVKTFTIGYAEQELSEAVFAKQVASMLGTEHHERIITQQEALDVVPLLGAMYDEPFADSSQIPTHLVAATARREVTVALAGDGGDEFFGGYRRYAEHGPTLGRAGRIPTTMRRVAASAARLPSRNAWNAVSAPAARLAGRNFAQFGDTVHRWAGVIAQDNVTAMYDQAMAIWEPGDVLTRDWCAPGELHDTELGDGFSVEERLMLRDTQRYLPEDILTKVDRASMAVSLEVRAPFLNPDIYAFAWSLPLQFRIDGGIGKILVRDVLARYLPREAFERPKMGFAIPVAAWLRDELRPWAEELLSADRLRVQGIFQPERVRTTWQRHLDNPSEDWSSSLWSILMFQAWWQTWMT